MRNKVLVASFFGNALEFYDFTLYGVFAMALAEAFFPSQNPYNAILMSWGAFGVGFLMRPFGASLFGYIGDKYGRKRALSLSILLMGFPTFVIGILPTYATIGLLAPITVVICRLLQGLCTGGEYNGAAIFSIEHNRGHKKGFIGGIITSSCVFGALTATGLGTLSLKVLNDELSWRLLFLMGSGISFIGFFIRRSVSESPEFSKSILEKTYFSHMLVTIRDNLYSFIVSILSGGLNGVLSYTLFGFLTAYLTRYHSVPLEKAMFSNVFGLLAFMLTCPFAGAILDKLGGRKYFLITTTVAMILPIFIFNSIGNLETSILVLLQMTYGAIVGMIAGPQHGFLQDLFPSENRYAGVSFGFCIGMGIIGGFTPFILTYLIKNTENLLMPGILVSGMALITSLSVFFLRQDKAMHPIHA